MIVSFERSGGFTGRGLKYVVNSDELPEADRNQLEHLVKTADFFDLPDQIKAPPGAADVFQFTITVEDEGRAHTVEFAQTVTPEKLKPLLQWLHARARSA
jgi:Emfourin